MDKTPKYIRMSDTPKIQERWEPEVGDWTDEGLLVAATSGEYAKDLLYVCPPKGQVLWDKQTGFIWLPTQSQSQGMVKPERNFPFNQVGDLIRWIDNYKLYSCSFDSMESLWLAFVIHELHQLTWDDEKGWVEEVK